MAEDKETTDRARATDENHKIEYMVVHTGISRVQARELIKRYGNNLETLMKHAFNRT